MTRRTPAQYDWKELEFDETLMRKHFTRQKSKNVKGVVVHHMAMIGRGDGAANDAVYRAWQTRRASAQYAVDGKFVRQLVWDKDYAWATGSYVGNRDYLSIEHANSSGAPKWPVSDETVATGARLAAYIHWKYKLGRPVSGKTLRQHDEFASTACPGPYLGGTHWDDYVREVQRVYDGLVGTPAPIPAPPVPKPKPRTYIVRRGDNLTDIARRFGTTVANLVRWNRLRDPNRIDVGQELQVGEEEAPAATLPSRILNLLNWKLTLPVGTKDKPVEVKQKALAKFKDALHFYVRGPGVVFQAPVNGVTTPNSHYPRSELREMRANGTQNADWSNRSGAHDMRLVLAITRLPDKRDRADKPGVVCGQIHDDEDDVVMVRLRGTTLTAEMSKGKGQGSVSHLLDSNYRLGTKFYLRMIADRDGVRVRYQKSGTTKVIEQKINRVFTGGYFKAGCYTQANSSNGTGYGEVIIYDLDVKHAS